MKFSTPFIFHNIEVSVPLIHIFLILASGKRAIIFFLTSKLANSSKKNVRHSALGQNMQISTFDVIRCVKPSSQNGHREEETQEWKVLRCRRAWFG